MIKYGMIAFYNIFNQKISEINEYLN